MAVGAERKRPSLRPKSAGAGAGNKEVGLATSKKLKATLLWHPHPNLPHRGGRSKRNGAPAISSGARACLRSRCRDLSLRYVFFCDIRSAAIMKLSNLFSATANHSTCRYGTSATVRRSS